MPAQNIPPRPGMGAPFGPPNGNGYPYRQPQGAPPRQSMPRQPMPPVPPQRAMPPRQPMPPVPQQPPYPQQYGYPQPQAQRPPMPDPQYRGQVPRAIGPRHPEPRPDAPKEPDKPKGKLDLKSRLKKPDKPKGGKGSGMTGRNPVGIDAAWGGLSPSTDNIRASTAPELLALASMSVSTIMIIVMLCLGILSSAYGTLIGVLVSGLLEAFNVAYIMRAGPDDGVVPLSLALLLPVCLSYLLSGGHELLALVFLLTVAAAGGLALAVISFVSVRQFQGEPPHRLSDGDIVIVFGGDVRDVEGDTAKRMNLVIDMSRGSNVAVVCIGSDEPQGDEPSESEWMVEYAESDGMDRRHILQIDAASGLVDGLMAASAFISSAVKGTHDVYVVIDSVYNYRLAMVAEAMGLEIHPLTVEGGIPPLLYVHRVSGEKIQAARESKHAPRIGNAQKHEEGRPADAVGQDKVAEEFHQSGHFVDDSDLLDESWMGHGQDDALDVIDLQETVPPDAPQAPEWWQGEQRHEDVARRPGEEWDEVPEAPDMPAEPPASDWEMSGEDQWGMPAQDIDELGLQEQAPSVPDPAIDDLMTDSGMDEIDFMAPPAPDPSAPAAQGTTGDFAADPFADDLMSRPTPADGDFIQASPPDGGSIAQPMPPDDGPMPQSMQYDGIPAQQPTSTGDGFVSQQMPDPFGDFTAQPTGTIADGFAQASPGDGFPATMPDGFAMPQAPDGFPDRQPMPFIDDLDIGTDDAGEMPQPIPDPIADDLMVGDDRFADAFMTPPTEGTMPPDPFGPDPFGADDPFAGGFQPVPGGAAPPGQVPQAMGPEHKWFDDGNVDPFAPRADEAPQQAPQQDWRSKFDEQTISTRQQGYEDEHPDWLDDTPVPVEESVPEPSPAMRRPEMDVDDLLMDDDASLSPAPAHPRPQMPPSPADGFGEPDRFYGNMPMQPDAGMQTPQQMPQPMPQEPPEEPKKKKRKHGLFRK